jgi:hypothetical protein
MLVFAPSGGRNSRNSFRPSLVVSELLVVNGPDLFSGVTSRDCIFAQHDLSTFSQDASTKSFYNYDVPSDLRRATAQPCKV